MFVISMSQALWLNFAAISNTVTSTFHVSELQAAYLTIVFPFFYMVFSVPAGIMIDRYGYRKVVLISTLAMAIAASIRLIPGNYFWVLTGQMIIAIAQAFIVNAIPKLIGKWFDDKLAALATSLATGGFFIGMLLGLGLSPFFTSWLGLSGMLKIFALLCWLSLFGFSFFPKKKLFEMRTINRSTEKTFQISAIWQLMKKKQFLLLLFLSLLTVGVFNALMTWMQPILSANSITQDQAGMVGAIMILGGIVGSILMSVWSDTCGKRKPFLLWICLLSSILIYFFTNSKNIDAAVSYGALLGLLFLPGYALLLTVVEEQVEKQLAGTATGFMMMVGNGGGVVLGILLEKTQAVTHHWLMADYLMIGLVLIAFVFVFALKETGNQATETIMSK